MLQDNLSFEDPANAPVTLANNGVYFSLAQDCSEFGHQHIVLTLDQARQLQDALTSVLSPDLL